MSADNVTPFQPREPEQVSTGYDDVAETPTEGTLLSEVVEQHLDAGDAISATVVGDSKVMRQRKRALARQNKARREQGVPQPSGQRPSWVTLRGYGVTLKPPYNPDELVRLPHISSILPQCLRALTQGIHGHGWSMEPTFDVKEMEKDAAFMELANAEKARGERFFTNASLEISFNELAMRTRLDMCTVGWSGWEFIRDMNTGALCGLEHVSAPTIRIGVPDDRPTLIHRNVMRPDGSGYDRLPAWRYLRRYVQIINGRMTFFKEPGDPRLIDSRTGAVVSPLQTKADLRSPHTARELLWFSHYDPASPEGYGIPPWIGVMVDIAGDRASSEVNWNYFTNKSVPPLAILVQGGALTKESHARIAEKLDELKGVDNWHKVLILEAKTGGNTIKDIMDPGGATTPRVTIEKLTSEQHGDALFQKYSANSREKARSACGVPPILVGESSDYTRATAQVSMEVFENFTAAPQRNQFDDRVNRFVLPELKLRYWKFRTNPANLADVEEVSKMIEAGVKAGVGNPNIWGQVIERVLNIEIPQSEQAWANFPVDLVKIALQSGMIALDFNDGSIGVEVNEGMRDKFKEMVGEILESTVDRMLLRARTMAANGEQGRHA